MLHTSTLTSGKLAAWLRTIDLPAAPRAVLMLASWAVPAALFVGPALAQPSAGLVARWTFDEGSGTIVHDASPNHNDGTLLNGASAWTSGHTGSGLYFDGASHTEVRIPASASLGQFTGATFAAWVYNADPARDGPIIAKEGHGALSYWFGCIASQFGALLSPDGTSWPTIEPSRQMGGVPANRWTHLATTWDGSTMRMYENGLLIGTYPYTQGIANPPGYTSIGVNSASNTTQFHGTLDDVCVYNRALSPDEVVSLMGTAACRDSFSDSFNPPSPLWSNLTGNWTASDIGYYAQNPSNSPYTYSGLPFDATDFEVSVQVNSLSDGGVWLRSDGSNRNGILLVTGGGGYGQGQRTGGAGTKLYFHRAVNGSFSGPLAQTTSIFTPGTNHSLRIVVSGSAYAVFVDGAASPATVLVDTTFSHGQVGLYCDQPNVAGGGSGTPQSFKAFSITGIGPRFDTLLPATICPSGTASFNAAAGAGNGPLTCHWQWQPAGAGTAWVNLTPGDNADIGGTPVVNAAGVDTDSLQAHPLAAYTNFAPRAFRCVIANSCGAVTTNAAVLTVCPADFNCDGSLDFFDYDDFVTCFEGDLCPPGVTADFNNDGSVDFFDYDDFVTAFEAGC